MTFDFVKKLDFSSEFFDLYKLSESAYAAISKENSGMGGNAGFIDIGDYLIMIDTTGNVDAGKDLKKAITIIYDDTFTQQLEQARKSSQEKDVFCLTIYNLIAPRKHYIQNILGYDPGFYSDTLTDEYKSCLTIGVNKLKDTLNIFLNQEQRSIIKNSKEDHRILIGFRWLNYKQSGKGDQQIPYIIKVGKTSSKRYMRASPYHIAELGIICGLYKKTNGLIFIVYPNLNNLIMTYKVDFKRQRELSRIVKKNVDNIENSEKNKDVSLLPLCEKFQCPVYKGESCPLEHECFHS